MNAYITMQKQKGEHVLIPRTDLVWDNVEDERPYLMGKLATDLYTNIVLDLWYSTFIDSSGICLIINILKLCKKRQVYFSVKVASTVMKTVFYERRLSDHMLIVYEDSLSE